MPPLNDLQLPFLTRKMLAFEYAVTFSLRIDMQADTAAGLSIRGMTREGMFTFSATTPSNSAVSQATFALPDIPIFITVEDTLRVLEQGNAFITVSLLANGNVIQQLVSGYVYNLKALSWPNTQQVDLRPGGGLWATELITAPAAGAKATISPPAGEMWLVRAASFTLVTDANAATRKAWMEMIDQTSGRYVAISDTTQTASLTRVWNFAPYGAAPTSTASTRIIANLPQGVLIDGPDGVIDLNVENIQAGDQISSPRVIVEKFFRTVV